MQIKSPQNRLGKLWLGKFNGHLSKWVASQRTDFFEFNEGLNSIKNLTERDLDSAAFVANTLSSLLSQHSDVLLPTEIVKSAHIGLEAINLVIEESELKNLTQINLLNYNADADFTLRHFSEAQEKLKTAFTILSGNKFESNVVSLLESHSRIISGSISEALLDYGKAFNEFETAYNLISKIIDDQNLFSKVFISKIQYEFPQADIPKEAIKAFSQLYWRMLSIRRVNSIVGALRCAVFSNPEKLEKLLTEFLIVIDKNGLGDTSALELAPIFLNIDSTDAEEVVEKIINSVKKLGLDQSEFTSILYAAIYNNKKINNSFKEKCRQIAEESLANIKDVLFQTAVLGLLFAGSEDESLRNEYGECFISHLQLLGKLSDKRLLIPDLKIVFDEPIIQVIKFICDKGLGNIFSDITYRTLLAKLIDYDFSGLTSLDSWLSTNNNNDQFDLAKAYSEDRLSRINFALKRWKGTLVLIIKRFEENTLFIAMMGDEKSIYNSSSEEYTVAANYLANFIEDEVSTFIYTKKLSPVDDLRQLGNDAFTKLPIEIKNAILRATQIFIYSEHRGVSEEIPYELFHDGNNWLGVDKIIARFPNLKTIVRCLEGTIKFDQNKRLLAVSVSNPGVAALSELKFASKERDSVLKNFEKYGWDTPIIDDKKVSTSFILDRLQYASHFHISCHGETTGNDESLVLNNGAKLSGSDLVAKFLPKIPTAFINACELGKTRWVGAGRSQSIPYSFINSGSRTVIANLLPVEDNISSDIATSFYKNIKMYSFGESLKLVRDLFDKKNIHPIFWATTVLFGDPTTSLSNINYNNSISENYLNAVVLKQEEGNDGEAVKAAQIQRISNSEDSRLNASIELLKVINTPDYAVDSLDLDFLFQACNIAYEIDYPPLLGYLVYLSIAKVEELYDYDSQLNFFDNAIKLFETLEGHGPMWKNMLQDVLVKWLKLIKGERMPQINIQGPNSNDDNFLDAAKAIFNIQFAMEANAIRSNNGPVLREKESSLDDIIWNAIVANRYYQFDGMPEKYDYARRVSRKLINSQFLKNEVQDIASTAFSGLLYWLWSSQNVATLQIEMIKGQSGVVSELVNSLSNSWKDQEWFMRSQVFENKLSKLLDSLEGLPYDDNLYPTIKKVMKQIRDDIDNEFEIIRKNSPELLCESTVYFLGLLIKHNKYSYVDGSVPEDIQKELEDILNHLNSQAEIYLNPWLMLGFKSVREEKFDELQRWKFNIPM